jgi:glycosyltransferase involved in cell wall biosynthesis
VVVADAGGSDLTGGEEAMSTSSEIKLSVIIPTYNRSGFLPGVVQSLRDSGIDGLEILVMDDGSTDDTAAVANALGEPVRYVRQANAGPATARNHGFDLCRGKYVAFVDSDDEWLPGAAAGLTDMLDRHLEIDVLFTEARMGNRQDGFVSWIDIAGGAPFATLPFREPEPGLRILERRPLFRRMAERNMVFISCTVLRREAFASAGMFDPTLCGAADWHLWLRLASRATFAYRAQPLGNYTRHDACMSNDHDGMKREFCLTLKKLLAPGVLGPDGDPEWVRQRLKHHLFGFAYGAYDRGNYPEARRRFGALLRDGGPELAGAAYWLLSALPFGLAGGVRQLKRRLTSGSEAPVAEPTGTVAAGR